MIYLIAWILLTPLVGYVVGKCIADDIECDEEEERAA